MAERAQRDCASAPARSALRVRGFGLLALGGYRDGVWLPLGHWPLGCLVACLPPAQSWLGWSFTTQGHQFHSLMFSGKKKVDHKL
jgi:hypothetical protein